MGVPKTDDPNSIELATEPTVAWLGNGNTRVHADDVPVFLRSMHDAVSKLPTGKAPQPQPQPEPEP